MRVSVWRNFAILKTARPKVDGGSTFKLKFSQSVALIKRGWKHLRKVLTLVRCQIFQAIIGTMKIGIPTYEATKSDELQLPLRKTGKPAISVMIVEPIKPTHAAYGWKGAFHGRLSRETPCAFIAA